MVTAFPDVAEAAQLRDALAGNRVLVKWERLRPRERVSLVADTQKHVVVLSERLACETAIRETNTSTCPDIVDWLLAAQTNAVPRHRDTCFFVRLVQEQYGRGSIGEGLVIDLDAID